MKYRNDQKADRIAHHAEKALAAGNYAMATKMFDRAMNLYRNSSADHLARLALGRRSLAIVRGRQ